MHSVGSPGEGNGKLLQCSCLENPTDRGAWWATVHAVAESDTSDQACAQCRIIKIYLNLNWKETLSQ